MALYKSMTDLIGATPLLELCAYCKAQEAEAQIFAKLESFNPCGSAKDRIALNMLRQALERGEISAGATIIEPTSGNTGIGVAAVSAAMGLKAIIVMPDSMSTERRQLMTAYGASLVLTDGTLGMSGAVEKARELHSRIENSFIPSQFSNPDNASAHEITTAPEIWQDCGGRVDIFVAGVGTGGTMTGCARYLKKMNPCIQIVAVEPADSPLLSQGKSGSHGLQGIGANFIPEVLDVSLIDEIITVTTEQAYSACRCLVKSEGLLCGITSGAAAAACVSLSRRNANKGKRIITVFPDSGEKYLSTGLFE